MADARERRRLKLLKREAELEGKVLPPEIQKQLDEQQKKVTDPQTLNQSASDNASKVTTSSSQKDQDEITTTKDHVVQPPKQEQPKVNLRELMTLMDDKKKYQVSTQLYRFIFSLLCGIWFHYAFMQRNLTTVTMPVFLALLQVFYYLLYFIETNVFTNKINAMKAMSQQSVSAGESLMGDLMQGKQPANQMDMMMNMMEQMGDSPMVAKIQTAVKVQAHVMNTMADLLTYVVGVLLIDACFIKMYAYESDANALDTI